MTYNIGTEEAPVMVPVRVAGGFVDCMVRAASRDVFDAVAKQVGLMVEEKEKRLVEPVDPDIGPTYEVVGTGEWHIADGVAITHVGPIVLTPAVLDEDGNEVTPAVMDTRHHANFRLYEPASTNVDADGNVLWHNWAVMWSTTGTAETPNTSEDAVALNGIALIDPDTITSPTRVWL